MFAGKPIIGIAGGIGSGKSHVARLLGDMGCRVIDSDAQVRQAYRDPAVLSELRGWWGDEVFSPGGEVDRTAIARKIFSSPADRQRLQQLLHPWVMMARAREMMAAAGDAQVLAFVWDTPLLFETGLNTKCDWVLFVDAELPERLRRVAAQRGWGPEEVARRENLQWPLDKKRQISDYVVSNTANASDLRRQIQTVLSRILDPSVIDRKLETKDGG